MNIEASALGSPAHPFVIQLASGEPPPRLITAPAAARYLSGERPETYGVKPISERRQRLYDLKAIDRALDQISGLDPVVKTVMACDTLDGEGGDEAAGLLRDWLG